jgi:hypothetical protein
MGLFGNGNSVLSREVSDHILSMENEKSPPQCQVFTSRVVGATKLALRLGEMAMKSNQKIIGILVILVVLQVIGMEFKDETLLTVLFKSIFK